MLSLSASMVCSFVVGPRCDCFAKDINKFFIVKGI